MKGRRIEDFVFGGDGSVYVLSSSPGSRARRFLLIKLDERGETVWEARPRLAQGREMARLFLDERARLHAAASAHLVTELDPRNGRAARSQKLTPRVDERLFVDVDGGIYRTVLIESQNVYAMTAVRSGEEEIAAGSSAHYGALQLCFGVDRNRRFYAYQAPREGRAGGLVRMGFGAGSIERYPYEEIVVQAGTKVVFSHFMDGARSVVERHDADGSITERIIDMPDEGGGDANAERRLLQVDEGGRLHFLVGEAPGSSGAILVFGEDGALLSVTDPAPKLRPRMSAAQSFRSWQVDGEGRVLIPVLEPHGLALIRFAAETEVFCRAQ